MTVNNRGNLYLNRFGIIFCRWMYTLYNLELTLNGHKFILDSKYFNEYLGLKHQY